jgi:hypothetical protein
MTVYVCILHHVLVHCKTVDFKMSRWGEILAILPSKITSFSKNKSTKIYGSS